MYTNDRVEWREREKQRRKQLEREDEAAVRKALEEKQPVPKPSKFKPRDPCRELHRQRIMRKAVSPVAGVIGPALAAVALVFGGPALIQQALVAAHGTALATGFAVAAAMVLAVAAVTVLSVFGQVRSEPAVPVDPGGEEDATPWSRITIGRFLDDGSPIEIPFGDHVLIAGATDAGKSNLVNVVISKIAPFPEVELYGIDLKGGVELGPWENVLVELAEDDKAAVALLRRLSEEMDRRYRTLRAAGRKNWRLQDGRFMKVIVDELAELPKAGVDLLTRLALLGRAAGISLVCATQQPEVAVIPQQARGQLRTVLGLRVERAEQARQVFGERATREGWDPASLDPTKRGSLLVRSKWCTEPRPGRSTRITDGEVRARAKEYARTPREYVAEDRPAGEGEERRCLYCGKPPTDPRAKYCSPAHRKEHWRRLRRFGPDGGS
jgi:S-DNA-T family DNA segregation ATPase FtsK/SpoIIIE